MLILTRKNDEEIKIGNDVTIRILSISENQVKLGISAPAEVEIFRAEIYDRVKESTIEASAKSKEKLKDLSNLKLNKLGK